MGTMVADKKVKELEGARAELTITVDAASVEKAYAAQLAKYAKEVQIDGFRKGKVPASVLERKFGDSIREESTFKVMEEGLEEALKDIPDNQKPIPFSTPELQNEESLLPFKKDQDVTFSVIYDIYPRVELPEYKGLTVEVPTVEITDKDVEDKIEELRDRNAIVRSKDSAAADGDIVTVSYAELDENGEKKAETERNDFTFTLGSGYNFYRIDSDVAGMKKGETKTVEKSYKEEDNVPGYAGKTVKLTITLNEVKTRELPEVDNAFAEDVKDEYKTVDDLKKGIRADYEKEVADRLRSVKEDALVREIAKKTDFALPVSMVNAQLEQRYRQFASQSGMKPEFVEKMLKLQNMTKEDLLENWRKDTEDMLKAQFILDEIMKKENFPVDEAELDKKCEESLKNIPDADKESYRNMIKDEMQFEKVIPFLLENNTFKEGKKLSYNEFIYGSPMSAEETEEAKEE